MAHTCPECYQYCTCNGDIDDIDFGEDPECTHCPVDGLRNRPEYFWEPDEEEMWWVPDKEEPTA